MSAEKRLQLVNQPDGLRLERHWFLSNAKGEVYRQDQPDPCNVRRWFHLPDTLDCLVESAFNMRVLKLPDQ
jgi:hypothetical protein